MRRASLFDRAHDLLDFAVPPVRFVIGFQVIPEQQSQRLPKIGIHRTLVLLDVIEGRVVCFPVDQANENLPLRDGQFHQRLLERVHEFLVLFLDNLFSFCLGIRLR